MVLALGKEISIGGRKGGFCFLSLKSLSPLQVMVPSGLYCCSKGITASLLVTTILNYDKQFCSTVLFLKYEAILKMEHKCKAGGYKLPLVDLLHLESANPVGMGLSLWEVDSFE